MFKRKYYKVHLSTIDFNKTMNSVDEMRSSNMLDVINSSNLVDLRDVIVYKTIFGNFREMITDKEVAAITEDLAPYSNSEHNYSLTRKKPVFFKCNISTSDDQKRKYPALDDMVADSNDVSEYLERHLGGDKSEYAMNVYEYLAQLYTEESNAIDKYEALLKHYGLEKKDKEKVASEAEKVKSLRKKYGI